MSQAVTEAKKVRSRSSAKRTEKVTAMTIRSKRGTGGKIFRCKEHKKPPQGVLEERAPADREEHCDEERLRQEYTELLRPHENALFAGALRFTNNRSDAEDLVQETYMRGYVGFKRSRKIDQPRAWLFKIMTNAYINRYHKKRRRPTLISYEDTLDHRIDQLHAPATEDPQKRFFAQFLDGEIRAALEGLPEHFRRSIILCDISGLSYGQISTALDCSLGTVRSRISRGREMLFQKLYDYAKERGILPEGATRGSRRSAIKRARMARGARGSAPSCADVAAS